MKKWTLFILLTLCVAASCSAQSMINLNGKYRCKGIDPTRTPSSFTGIETYTTLSPVDPMNPKAGTIYNIAETDNNGNTSYTYHQFGILHDHTLSMAYQYAQKNLWGVQYMTVSHHGDHLDGIFVFWDKFKEIASEHCVRIKA